MFVCYRYVSRRVSCNHNTVRTTARQADRLALAQPGSCSTHTLTHSHSHSQARRWLRLRLRSFTHDDDRQAQTRCCVFHTRCAWWVLFINSSIRTLCNCTLQLALADYVWLPHLAARCNHFTSLTCNGFTLFSLSLSFTLSHFWWGVTHAARDWATTQPFASKHRHGLSADCVAKAKANASSNSSDSFRFVSLRFVVVGSDFGFGFSLRVCVRSLGRASQVSSLRAGGGWRWRWRERAQCTLLAAFSRALSLYLR